MPKFGDVLYDQEDLAIGMYVAPKPEGYTGPGATDSSFDGLVAMFHTDDAADRWSDIEDWPTARGWKFRAQED